MVKTRINLQHDGCLELHLRSVDFCIWTALVTMGWSMKLLHLRKGIA
jgi:hypothetical protein